jgi:hypothetical protein
LCERFATTAERRALLDGFLRFRELLAQAGFTRGFQWHDGSFLENVEAEESRAPRDLDIVTFYIPPDPNFNGRIAAAFPILADPSRVKRDYGLDHYFLDAAKDPMLTVEGTRYWAGLFSHRRDGTWKGMLRIDLSTPAEDTEARAYLNGLR